MNSAEACLALAGAVGLMTCACLWFSPYLCRLIAAALLTHANTTDTARDFRRQEWGRQLAAMESHDA